MPRWLRILLIVLLAAVFLFSSYQLLSYYGESRKRKAQFGELSATVEKVRGEATAPDRPQQSDSPQPTFVEVTNPKTGEVLQAYPEYAAVYRQNSDMVGWLKLEGTVIDYPVLQTPDRKDYYLRRGFDGAYSVHGCLYAKETCDVFAPSDNVTIYGHKMHDGTMFAELLNYKDPAYYAEHPLIRFDTLNQYRTYRIVAVFSASASSDMMKRVVLFTDAASEAELQEFFQKCAEASFYDTGETASYGDKLLTLCTCDYDIADGRLVVVAKRVD